MKLLGTLTVDPDLRFVPSGSPMLTFRLAVGDGEDLKFVDCEAWDELAEEIADLRPFLARGDTMAVAGGYRRRSWEDRHGERHTHRVFRVSAYRVRRKAEGS